MIAEPPSVRGSHQCTEIALLPNQSASTSLGTPGTTAWGWSAKGVRMMPMRFVVEGVQSANRFWIPAPYHRNSCQFWSAWLSGRVTSSMYRVQSL